MEIWCAHNYLFSLFYPPTTDEKFEILIQTFKVF